MRSVAQVGIVLVTGWVALTGPVPAEQRNVQATVDTPARIMVEQPANHASTPDRPSRVVVSVTGFVPSSNGPVEAIVIVHCGAEQREIGRFGMFPNVAFSATQPSQVQRFGFALPDDGTCPQPMLVTVRLEPSSGDGRDARMTIGSATYQ